LRDPDQLAQYLAAARVSQAELARQAGVSRQFIHRLLSGKCRSCTYEVAEAIEITLRVRPGTLFFVPGESPGAATGVAATGDRGCVA